MTQLGLTICGLGAAGTGLLLAAANYGCLDALLDAGVLGIERSSWADLDSNLRTFQVRANSYGAAFLEILSDPAGTRVLDGLGTAAETTRLSAVADGYPPLDTIGAFMSLVTRRTATFLADARGGTVLAGTVVDAVELVGRDITVTTRDGHNIVTRHVALTMGGTERTDLDDGLVSELVERRLAGRVSPGSDVLRDPSALDGCGRVAVLGGSHSAWAVVVALLRRRPRREVWVVERRPPPIYYESTAAADADGYDYDPVDDVCPRSGRVNRFGGLRGETRDVALRIMSGAIPTVHVVDRSEAWTVVDLADSGVLPADALVGSLGYTPRLPTITRDGRPLRLLRAGAGLAVGCTGVVHDGQGVAVPGLYAFGMGAGLTPSPDVGGEPSYRGRLDGVWLYQHHVGRAVLTAMGLLS